jgi:hypothetical protein
MFRIGEFSKLTQVSVRLLRYYDETGLLKTRADRQVSGYRLYSAERSPPEQNSLFAGHGIQRKRNRFCTP